MKVVVSGYFDPIHIGHLKMFKEASQLGDLIVIINNNKQTKTKKGYVFMPDYDRAELIKELSCVKNVFISIDKDQSVCKSLEALKPDYFCNGGDRFEGNIPEVDTCNKLGIKMIFNVGGKKIRSSSELVRRVK